MELTRALVKEFAKVINNSSDKNKKTSTSFNGTAVVDENGNKFVKIDGSDQITPISEITDVQNGDRVLVSIENHKATVIGNYSYPPSLRKATGAQQAASEALQEVMYLSSTMITTENLKAQVAELGYMSAEQANITYAKITELDALRISVEEIEAKGVSAETIKAVVAEIGYITAGEADLKYATIEDLNAKTVTADEIRAAVADVGYITADQADVRYLTVESADLKYANIELSNVEVEHVGTLFARIGILEDVTISKGYVTGVLNGVRINADVITAGTLSVDRLLITGKNSIVYQINAESSGLSMSELTDEKYQKYLNGTDIVAGSITGDRIAANTITANNINVFDLFAEDINASGSITGATLYGTTLFSDKGEIGGWKLIDKCIYSETELLSGQNIKYTAVLQNMKPSIISPTAINGSDFEYTIDGNDIYIVPSTNEGITFTVQIPMYGTGKYQISIYSEYAESYADDSITGIYYYYIDTGGDFLSDVGVSLGSIKYPTVNPSHTDTYVFDYDVPEDAVSTDPLIITSTMPSASAGTTYKFSFSLLKDGIEIADSNSPIFGVSSDVVIGIKKEDSGNISLPFYILRDGTIYSNADATFAGSIDAHNITLNSALIMDAISMKNTSNGTEYPVLTATNSDGYPNGLIFGHSGLLDYLDIEGGLISVNGFEIALNATYIQLNGPVQISAYEDYEAELCVDGLLSITANGNTVQIGSLNETWCHFNNSADIPFYFNKAVHAVDGFTVYNSATSLENGALKIGSNVYGHGYIELCSATPFIDFRYGNSASDYTSRIIATASGILNITGKLTVADTVEATNGFKGMLLEKGFNTITSTANDTTANWSKHCLSMHYYSVAGQLIDQPSTYGFLLNLGRGSDVHQIWMTQSSGNMAHRSGNQSGWGATWKVLLDSGNYKDYPCPYIVSSTAEKYCLSMSNQNVIPGKRDSSNAFVSNTGKTSLGTTTNYFASLLYNGSLSKQSDRRSKNPLGQLSIDETLTLMRGLSIEKFTYLNDDNQVVNYGVYAQEFRDLLIGSGIGHVAALTVGVVETDEVITDIFYDEELVRYSVDYTQFIPLTIKGWQYHDVKLQNIDSRQDTMQLQIEQLQDENSKLKKRIETLKQQLLTA